MHRKIVVEGDGYGTVGTANFDSRAFRLNVEIIRAFTDAGFTDDLAGMAATAGTAQPR